MRGPAARLRKDLNTLIAEQQRAKEAAGEPAAHARLDRRGEARRSGENGKALGALPEGSSAGRVRTGGLERRLIAADPFPSICPLN